MRNYFPILDRRRFCWSITGLAANVALARLPFGIEKWPKIAALDQEFLIVNGWVLTRKDVATA